MNEFIPRTRAPAEDDKHWINIHHGGYNECIVIDHNTGSVLPNCVGYAWGRAYELLKEKPKLPCTDAKTWYNAFEGYSRGKVPTLGAIACWGGTQYGHVAVVESIGNDYIMCSQSNYGGERWELVKCLKGGAGYISGAGNPYFQGFIYLPVKWDAVGSGSGGKSDYKSVNDIALAIIRGIGTWYKCTGQNRYKKIHSYGYDPEEVQSRVNELMLTSYHNIEDIARAIIRGTGIWYQCYGEERKRLCEYFGFNYDEVQSYINELIAREHGQGSLPQ